MGWGWGEWLTLIMLGVAIWAFVPRRRSAPPSRVQRAGVKTFAPPAVRPRQPVRPTVSPMMVIGYYLRALASVISFHREQFQRGWRTPARKFVMSPPSTTVTSGASSPPTITAAARPEPERELGTAPERRAEQLADGDIITKEITQRQREVLQKKIKPLIDAKLLSVTDVAVLMGLRTIERSAQVREIIDTPPAPAVVEQAAA